MSDTTIELCNHVCNRCGRCLDQCCPGHTREDQRDAWRQALAARAKDQRILRGRSRQRAQLNIKPGMTRFRQPATKGPQ